MGNSLAPSPHVVNGTTVTINGQFAFLDYVSPSQVDAQVPSNVDIGPIRSP